MRVLIVDDHEMVAQALAEVLDHEDDLEVVGRAATVEDARALVRSRGPDIVLMDYRLRDGDGVKATELIKADRPEVQVVMVTSVLSESVLVPAIEAGCSGFVTKDRPVEEVVAALRAAHAGESLISPAMLAHLLPRLRPSRTGPSKKGVGEELTPRELEVLRLLARGMSNQAIADQLVLSLKTVRNHVQSVITKLQAHSKLEAVTTAVDKGIVTFGG